MIDLLEKTRNHDLFLEMDFEDYPFQLKYAKENINLSTLFNFIVENLETQDPQIKKQIDTYVKKFDDKDIEINYKNKNINIFRHPIKFEPLYEENIKAFKVYENNQLIEVLKELKRYYTFCLNYNFVHLENINKIYDIIELKKKEKINENKIIFIPHVYFLFRNLCYHNKFEDMIKAEKDIFFDIDKELLEPFFLYIEKNEINKIIGDEKMKKFDENLLEKKLTFYFNEERKNFIKKLDDYIGIDIQSEPMTIIGNDGIGKSLTLQFYTLLEFKGYKKIYLNTKLLEKCNNRDYILIELIRAFISKEENQEGENFINYMNFINNFQNIISSVTIKFYELLIGILKYLKRNNKNNKYIIIIDQFNFEKINSEDFENFKSRIPDNEQFKIIICCSLSDDENKKDMFSDYQNLNIDKLNAEMNFKPLKNLEISEDVDDLAINFKGKNIEKFYFINKLRKDEEIINKDNKNMTNEINIKVGEDKKIHEDEEQSDEGKKEEIKDENKMNQINTSPNSQNNKSNLRDFVRQTLKDKNFKAPIIPKDTKTICNEKTKIYYNKLISLEKIFDDNNEIKECMSNFDYLPKYYYKFYLFRVVKKLEGETNISLVIKYFYEQQMNNIKDNINKFYSKLDLNQKKDVKNPYVNIYQNLLKLIKCIRKTYEESIPLFKLYDYSSKFPFKYINIQTENEKNDIIFNKELRGKNFKLAFSFPLVEKVIENMIEGFNNNDKIDINELSGSAYGNALEIKIRENLNKFKQNIEIRKVWSLDKVSDAVIKEKLKEINKNKDISKRYQDCEDIIEKENIKLSNSEYFYFKPENQINKYFDSLFLIKNNDKSYSIIALQITKNKPRKKVNSKSKYSEFLIKNVKKKFKKLYHINISNIYFWFILSHDSSENDYLCQLLNEFQIQYIFYSIKNQAFYKKRNEVDEIKDLKDLTDIKSLIYNENVINNNSDDEEQEDVFEPSPDSIKLFENELYIKYKKNKNIFFETVRFLFYGYNFGPKLGINLKTNIINNLKNFIPFSNEIEIMFLFAIYFKNIDNFMASNQKEQLIYLFKFDTKTYLLYKEKYFEISNETLINCDAPPILYFNLTRKIKYNKKEIEFSSIEDIYQNSIVYLFKIYYLGEELLPID